MVKMMADKKESPLQEKHAAGKELYRTFRDIRNKKDWNHSEFRMIAIRFIPKKKVTEWTNENLTGYIDIAQMKELDLNNDEYIRKVFWPQVELGFGKHMEKEDQDVRRGFMACDGMIRLGDKGGDESKT
jgi:hypothetical protein